MAPRVFKKCSFGYCDNTSANSQCLFFNYRKHDVSNWVAVSENSALLGLSVNNLLKHHYVCDEHFCINDFTRVLSPFKKKLKKTTIPSASGAKGL
jgi:hypothetical protein